MTTVRDRVVRVVSEVLNVSPDAVTDNAGPDTLTSWDSVSHLNLVLALEAEFDVSLTDDDIMDMLSVGLILTILRDKGVDGQPRPASVTR